MASGGEHSTTLTSLATLEALETDSEPSSGRTLAEGGVASGLPTGSTDVTGGETEGAAPEQAEAAPGVPRNKWGGGSC